MKKGFRLIVLIFFAIGLVKGAADVKEPFVLEDFPEMPIPDSELYAHSAGLSGESTYERVNQESKPIDEQTVMNDIRVTAGDEVLYGVLYDNPTAREFAAMLPITTDLWHPAIGFARAFGLPNRIEEKGIPGYEYELGSLAYWDGGPSIALVYKANREKTVVRVVPVGKITSDVSVFETYGDTITVEIIESPETGENPQK